jgi:mannosyltransferase OCH1-like enzyme
MLANSFIAAPPEHRALKSLLEALPEIRRRLPDAPAWWTTGPLPFTLAARCGPLLLADASFTAGSVKADAGEEQVRELVRRNERAKGGLLLAWKPWDISA